jgi:hypothetical protein
VFDRERRSASAGMLDAECEVRLRVKPLPLPPPLRSSLQSSVSGDLSAPATSGNSGTQHGPLAAGIPETPPGTMGQPRLDPYDGRPYDNTWVPQASGYGPTPTQVAPSPVPSMAFPGSQLTDANGYNGYNGLGGGHWPQAEGVRPPGLPTGFMSYGVDPTHRFPPGTDVSLGDAAAIYGVGDGHGDQGSYGQSEVTVTWHSALPYDVSSVLVSVEPGASAYVNEYPGTYGPNFQLQQGMPAPPPDGFSAPSWVTVSNDMAAASGSGVSGSPQAHHSQTQGNPSTPTHWTSYDPERGY